MLARNCWKRVASSSIRAMGLQWPGTTCTSQLMPMAAVDIAFSNRVFWTQHSNTWTDDATVKTSAAFVTSMVADSKRLFEEYQTTDFDTTLKKAPKHTVWAVIVPLVPLVAKTAWAGITLSCDSGYTFGVLSCVSAYVCIANGLWLRQETNAAGDCGCDGQSRSLSPWLLWLSLQKTVGPATICAIAVVTLPQSAAVVAVTFAAFQMTCRLVLNGPPGMPPWCKSLVLIVYGVFVPSLTLALVCSLFS